MNRRLGSQRRSAGPSAMASVAGTRPSHTSRCSASGQSSPPTATITPASGSRASTVSGQPASSTSKAAPDSGWMIGAEAILSAPQNSGSTAHQASHGQGGPAKPRLRQGRSASARPSMASSIKVLSIIDRILRGGPARRMRRVMRRHAGGPVVRGLAGENRAMTDSSGAPQPLVHWTDDDGPAQQARWRSLAGHPPPPQLVLADDALGADAAYRLLNAGTAILWLGDYQNARHLLQALGRRLDKRLQRPGRPHHHPTASLTEAFHTQRRAQAERARILGGLLLPFDD